MQQATQQNFQELIKTTALIHFSAPWCKPCKTITEECKVLEKKFSEVIFAEVNVEKEQKLASEQVVIAIPTLLLYKGGKEIERFSGEVPLEVLKAELALKLGNHTLDEVIFEDNN